MPHSTRKQLIMAGLQLYPSLGYQKLSLRTVAAQAGVSTGMFHHVFKNKQVFVEELLYIQYAQSFGKIDTDFAIQDSAVQAIKAIKILKQFIWDVAICIREQLLWVQRIFADSTDGVAVCVNFLREHLGRISRDILTILKKCMPNDTPSRDIQFEYLLFLYGAVFSPLIFANRVEQMNLFSADRHQDIHFGLPKVYEDYAIRRRIDWAFSIIFPSRDKSEQL